MARKATGNLIRRPDGRWQIRVTFVDGTRKRLPPLPVGTTEAQARKVALDAVTTIKKKNLVLSDKARGLDAEGPTVAEYVDAVFSRRNARGLRRQDNERARIRNHVEPVLAERKVMYFRDITAKDCRAIVESLDGKISNGTMAGATARCTWHLWRLICREACASKIDGLRVRDDNPARDVLPPEKTPRKARQWLYPEELERLLACDTLPLRWRRLYAVAVYLCLRAGEVGALDAAAIDFERGRVKVDKAIQRDDGEIGTTKTDDTRDLSVPPTILPLLRALVDEVGGSGPLLPLPPFEDLAETLRSHVRRAGITRPELFAPTKTSIPLRFHDLRATGISHLAMLPELTAFDIRDYAGHSEVATTDQYVRRGRNQKSNLRPFGPLPVSLLGAKRPNESAGVGSSDDDRAELGSSVWRPQRDSNSWPKTSSAVFPGDLEVSSNSNPQPNEAKCSNPGRWPIEKADSTDPIESALSRALDTATTAGRWDVVTQIGAELQARRLARDGVPSLTDERKRRTTKGGQR